jgi:hypothetical protein
MKRRILWRLCKDIKERHETLLASLPGNREDLKGFVPL